ncbi:MAG: DUF2461 family protein [Ruminococcus sp.]|nr:DUF2461 family protein [Ruminococcus sp.]
MFNGFTQEAFDFLLGIRLNNSKEWFEPRKEIYTSQVYEPMKALGEEIYAPFADTGMMSKTGRIYRDTTFPPYLHYRDVMWIYVRYPAWYWNRTPTLFFELSPEGAEFGFRIAKPQAAVMERFRAELAEDPAEFLKLVSGLRGAGITVDGEEYKRSKPCSTPEAAEFFRKKALYASVWVRDMSELSRSELAQRVIEVFHKVQPLNEMFHRLVEIQELADQLEKESLMEAETAEETVKAPDSDFMW